MNTDDKRKWVPEIFYEDSEEGMAGNLPFIQVPEDKEMPGVLFIFSSELFHSFSEILFTSLIVFRLMIYVLY